MEKLHTMPAREAEKRGYRPIAGPYDLGHETPAIRRREHLWWARVCSDLCTVDSVAIEVAPGKFEAWRHESELLEVDE